jgi:hypothetical protein
VTVRVLVAEWIWGVRHWRFGATIALTAAVLWLTMMNYGPLRGAAPVPAGYYNVFSAMLNAMGLGYGSLYVLFLPALAAWPRGDSVAADRARGLDSSIISRSGWRGYLWGKLAGNLLLSGTAASLGLAVAFMGALMRYPAMLPHYLGYAIPRNPPPITAGVFGEDYGPRFMSAVFWHHPWIYMAIVAFFAVWATMSLASVATVSAVWIRHRFLVTVMPVLIFWGGNVVAGLLGIDPWMPSTIAGTYLAAQQSWISLLVYWAVPLVGAAFLIYRVVHREEWIYGGQGA